MKTTRNRSIPVLLASLAIVSATAWWLTRQRQEPVTAPEPAALRPPPAEFEPQEALLLGGTQLAGSFPGLLAEIVAAAAPSAPVVVLVNTREEDFLVRRILTRAAVPADRWSTVQLPIRSLWVRDFGPYVVRRGQQPEVVGFHYRERRGNRVDNTVPAALAERWKTPYVESPLLLEGGDLIGNGQGVCLSTDRLIKRNIHYLQMDDQEMGGILRDRLGFRRWDAFPQLVGEPTGRLDMFLTLVAADHAVVGSYDAADDSVNAALLDDTARRLGSIEAGSGVNFRVTRIEQPPHQDGVWRTYTNVVYANGTLLVPQYSDCCPDLDERALKLYRGVLPGWRVVGVDVSQLIVLNGALRCITMNVPRGPGRPVAIP